MFPRGPIELLGTIYLGRGGTSVATIKDKEYPESDVYKVGDKVIGNEQASIAGIERQKVIINNANDLFFIIKFFLCCTESDCASLFPG